MAVPSVTYTFVNGTTADGGQVSTNFNDLILALTDGTRDLTIGALTCQGAVDLNSSVNLGINVSYELAPTSLYLAPTTRMVWKDINTITVQAGRYFLNNKVYTLAANLDWTWAASGQNGGLDTGAEANSTWYYLYGTLIGAAFGVVASTTAPTNIFDTNLSGTAFDTNVYLGAFYNTAGGSVQSFVQNKAFTRFTDFGVQVGPFTNTGAQAKTLVIPTTANMVYLRIDIQPNAAGNLINVSAVSGESGTLINGQVAGIEFRTEVWVPIVTSQTVFAAVATGSDNGYLWPLGWMDKWL